MKQAKVELSLFFIKRTFNMAALESKIDIESQPGFLPERAKISAGHKIYLEICFITVATVVALLKIAFVFGIFINVMVPFGPDFNFNVGQVMLLSLYIVSSLATSMNTLLLIFNRLTRASFLDSPKLLYDHNLLCWIGSILQLFTFLGFLLCFKKDQKNEIYFTYIWSGFVALDLIAIECVSVLQRKVMKVVEQAWKEYIDSRHGAGPAGGMFRKGDYFERSCPTLQFPESVNQFRSENVDLNSS